MGGDFSANRIITIQLTTSTEYPCGSNKYLLGIVYTYQNYFNLGCSLFLTLI